MSLLLQPNSATLPWEQQHRFPPIIPTYLLAVVNVLMFSLQAARRRCWQTLRVVRVSRRSRSPVSHFAPPCDAARSRNTCSRFRGRRRRDRDLDEMGGGTSRPRPRIDARNVETARTWRESDVKQHDPDCRFRNAAMRYRPDQSILASGIGGLHRGGRLLLRKALDPRSHLINHRPYLW